jgi:hypothetical protein
MLLIIKLFVYDRAITVAQHLQQGSCFKVKANL